MPGVRGFAPGDLMVVGIPPGRASGCVPGFVGVTGLPGVRGRTVAAPVVFSTGGLAGELGGMGAGLPGVVGLPPGRTGLPPGGVAGGRAGGLP